MANKIVFVVGMPGSGKSLVSDTLREQGFSYLRFGQITLDKVKEQGLEPNEENERRIREGFRKEHGMAAFAKLNMLKIDKLLERTDVVVDGLYSWSEYKVLKEKYKERMFVWAVFAPPGLRYERLENRTIKNDKDQRFRSFTKKEALARDYAEIEKIEKGGPIVMADFTLLNTGTKDEIKKSIERALRNLK